MIGALPAEKRHKTVILPAAVDEEERRRIREGLLPLAAVDAVDIDGRRCRLDYVFPETTFGRIWVRLQSLTVVPFSTLSRLRYNLIAVMEDNECEARLHAGGWHHYVDVIHAHRFDPLHTGSIDTRKQQWQQYGSRRRRTTDA